MKKIVSKNEVSSTLLSLSAVQSIEEDNLGAKASALSLAQLLWEIEPPFTVAVRGDWGMGKSSLIHMTQSLFKAKAEDGSLSNIDKNISAFRKEYSGSVEFVNFNPWADSELLQNSNASYLLIEQFIGALKEKKFIDKKSAGAFMKRLGRSASRMLFMSAMSKIGAKGSKEFSETFSPAASENQMYSDDMRTQISKALLKSASKKKIVFFIDDLDRLPPEQAISILDTISTLLNMPKCVFVIAVDQDVLMKGVLKKFEGDKDAAQNYFDKAFNLSIRLSNSLTGKTLHELVSKQWKIGERIVSIPKQVQPLLVNCAFGNPRTLKRQMMLADFRLDEFKWGRASGVIGGDYEKLEPEDELAVALGAIENVFPQFHRLVFISDTEESKKKEHYLELNRALQPTVSAEESNENDGLGQQTVLAKQEDALKQKIDESLKQVTTVARFVDEADKGEKIANVREAVLNYFRGAVSLICDDYEEPTSNKKNVNDSVSAEMVAAPKITSIYANRRASGRMASYVATSLPEVRKNFGFNRSYPQSITRYWKNNWTFASVYIGNYQGHLKQKINCFRIFMGSSGCEVWVQLKSQYSLPQKVKGAQFEFFQDDEEQPKYGKLFKSKSGVIGTIEIDETHDQSLWTGSGDCLYRHSFSRSLEFEEDFEKEYDNVYYIAEAVISSVIEIIAEEDN